MIKRTGTQSTKKADGHGDRSVTTPQSPATPRASGQQKVVPGVTRKNTNPTSATQEGAPKVKKVQPVIKQNVPQTPKKQEQKAVTTASTSNNTTVTAPAPPKITLEYKPLNVDTLKCGDMVLILHHFVPDTTEIFHWMIYFHLGNNIDGQIIHATPFATGNPDEPPHWKFDFKPHTLYTTKLAYARLLGHMSGLNAANFTNFAKVIEKEVPVPYIPRDDSPNRTFSCSIWAASFLRYARKEKYITLPYSIEQLRKEMLEKGISQAKKAEAKCKIISTRTGPALSFRGYVPLLEYVVIITTTA